MGQKVATCNVLKKINQAKTIIFSKISSILVFKTPKLFKIGQKLAEIEQLKRESNKKTPGISNN